MNIVERVKQICDDRKVPVAKLERDCGFSNGYIGKLREGTMPADRLYVIARYFDLSTDYLITGISSSEFLSKDEITLLNLFRKLNSAAQEKLIDYADMLSRLPEHQKGQKSLGSNVG